MDDFLKVAGACLCAAVLASALERRDRALALGLGLLACAAALIALLRSLRPAARFLEELTELSGLGGEYLEPLLKAAGVGVATQIACAVCCDGGQNTLAKTVELCGVCAAALLTLPLLRAGLVLIRQMMGG